MKQLLCIVFCFFSAVSFTQENAIEKEDLAINDGPYIFIEKDHLVEKNIINGEVKTKKLNLHAFPNTFIPESSVYTKVNHIVALSDIHGQFDLAITILKNNNIIDDNLNWIFGKGHFVIVGDVFDRGPKVTETLWFLYHLEAQAKKAGGKVHLLLGNHEYMILHKDFRYIHKKYEITSQILNKSYDELFSNQTVLGKWLRSKATVIKINDNLFVHGGISPKFLEEKFNIDNVNRLMRESLDRKKTDMKSSPFYKRYYSSSGPIWYRGYFNDNLDESVIDTVLRKVGVNHLVVGHCSQEKVLQLYNKKIFAVDSSIKNGEYGEVLFINVAAYSRGTKYGELIPFD